MASGQTMSSLHACEGERPELVERYAGRMDESLWLLRDVALASPFYSIDRRMM